MHYPQSSSFLLLPVHSIQYVTCSAEANKKLCERESQNKLGHMDTTQGGQLHRPRSRCQSEHKRLKGGMIKQSSLEK